MVTALSALATEVDQRQERNDYKNEPRVLVIAGMSQARDFNSEGSYDGDGESPSQILGRILRDGPEVGVFVVAWFDRAAGVKKRLEHAQLGEFGQRLLTQASRDDSLDLIESDGAAGLKPGQGVLADVDRSTEQKVRTFAVPGAQWLASFIADVKTG
jgi:DNA segregation ATPase FtsK/SpoIIIE, S-DNA-T family